MPIDWKKLYQKIFAEKKVLKQENEKLKAENEILKKKLLIIEHYTGPTDTRILYEDEDFN
tara:strand:+ start:1067 stop:1246 length:180 start_codon:yes stop_codon:yes gene_type:complete